MHRRCILLPVLTRQNWQILKHLSLEDLINVSRSSKFFAPWLLSRNHQSIWIAARQNYPVPIPAPRAPFKEQRWAAALVERYCHVRRNKLLSQFQLKICNAELLYMHG